MTQRMCDETVYNCLVALKRILDWRFTSKMIKNRYTLYAEVVLLFLDKDSGDVTLYCNEMRILNVNLININFNNNIDEDINAIIVIR